MLMSKEADIAVQLVADRRGLKPEEVFLPNQRARIVSARRTVFTALRMMDWSFREIARYFGYDHTTVIHHVSTANEMETSFALRVVRYVNARQEEEAERYGLDD